MSPTLHAPADPYLRLRRSGCHGICPDYTLSVLGNGQVSFYGRRYVTCLGNHRGWITTTRVEAITTAFHEADFLSLPPTLQCPPLPDCSSTIQLFFRDGGVSRTVTLAPAMTAAEISEEGVALQRIANQIDILAKSRHWIGDDQAWAVGRGLCSY